MGAEGGAVTAASTRLGFWRTARFHSRGFALMGEGPSRWEGYALSIIPSPTSISSLVSREVAGMSPHAPY